MVLGELSFTGCRVCGWAALPGSSLCVGCLDIREWSRVNRAFCDLLHRDGTQAPGTAGSSTVATELALTA
jgi:hypothetical protein